MPAFPAQEIAERAARGGEGGIEPDRRAQVLARAGHVAAPAHEPAQFVVGAGIGGIKRQGETRTYMAPPLSSLRRQGFAEIVQREDRPQAA